jgi:hypothetical protein
MKVQLGGKKFQTDEKVKRIVLYWLRTYDKKVYAARISNL